MLSPVRLSVDCNVCALKFVVEIYGNFSSPFGTLAIHYKENFTEIVPPSGGLNARGVDKYSDF